MEPTIESLQAKINQLLDFSALLEKQGYDKGFAQSTETIKTLNDDITKLKKDHEDALLSERQSLSDSHGVIVTDLSKEITELKSEIIELKQNHGVAINDLKEANADKATEKDAEWKAKLDTANDKVSELSKERDPQKFKDRQKAFKKKRTLEQREEVKRYRREYSNKRRQEDPIFRITQDARTMLRNSFVNRGFRKGNTKTENVIGLSFEKFKEYLESQFEPWMNWENRGGRDIKTPNTNWDVDHIIPVSTAKTVEDVIRLNHYTNLRPMCSYANRFLKKDNLDWQPNG